MVLRTEYSAINRPGARQNPSPYFWVNPHSNWYGYGGVRMPKMVTPPTVGYMQRVRSLDRPGGRPWWCRYKPCNDQSCAITIPDYQNRAACMPEAASAEAEAEVAIQQIVNLQMGAQGAVEQAKISEQIQLPMGQMGPQQIQMEGMGAMQLIPSYKGGYDPYANTPFMAY